MALTFCLGEPRQLGCSIHCRGQKYQKQLLSRYRRSLTCNSVAAAKSSTAGVSSLKDLPTVATPGLLSRFPQPASSEDPADASYVPPPPEQWHLDPVLMAGCEPGKQLNVAVLLSGGVDSSLALRLLVAAGHKCKAFYLQIWFQEDFRNFWDSCPWEEDLEYARRVCNSLGVPLEVVPMTTQYWERVVSHSVAEIRAGRTPNPDMLCNSRVKFGAFLDFLEQREAAAAAAGSLDTDTGSSQDSAGNSGSGGSSAGGSQVPERYDRIASGHYARVVRGSPAGPLHSMSAGDHNGTGTHTANSAQGQHFVLYPPEGQQASDSFSSSQQHHLQTPAQGLQGPVQGAGAEDAETAHLCLTPDAIKDQTYFLAHLSPRQLGRTMFPLGALTKAQVRKLASAAGLATQSRKDSQGICFLGKVKFSEFVEEHLGTWPGLIVEEDQQPNQQQQQQSHSPQGDSTQLQATDSISSSNQSNGVQQLNQQQSQQSQGRRRRGGGSREGGSSSTGERGGAAPVLASFRGRKVLGIHNGYWFYTVGQRGGIKLPGGPWYVVRKDCDLNLLYVSRQYHEASRSRSAFNAGPFSWLSPLRPQTGPDAPPLYCKVRHGPHAYRCELRVVQAEAGVQQSQPAAGPTSVTAAGEAPVGAGATKGSTHGGPAIEVQVWDPTESKALVVLDGNDQGLAAGQWAVFYQGGVCLGAAVIQGPPAGLVAPFSGAGARGRHVTLTAAGESEA